MVKGNLLFAVIFGAALFCRCANDAISSTSHPDSIPMGTAIVWKSGAAVAEPDEVDSIRIRVVTGPEFGNDTVSKTFAFSRRAGTITVPNVARLQVFVEGLDTSGAIVYEGGMDIENESSDYLRITIEASLVSPPKPSRISIEAASVHALRISWIDNSSNEDGFVILRGTTLGDFDTLASLPPNDTMFIDSTIDDSTSYFYRVIAFNGAGGSIGDIPQAGRLDPPAPFFVQDNADLSGSVHIGEYYSRLLQVSALDGDSFEVATCSLIVLKDDSVTWTPLDAHTGENFLWATVLRDGEVVDSCVWTVTVIDTISPILTLNGTDTIQLAVGELYTEPGAKASDNADGDISDDVKISGEVRTDSAGHYTITYSVADKSGNQGREVKRLVIVSAGQVEDITPPVITLLGRDIDTIDLYASYYDSGATASDNREDNISERIEALGDVDTMHPGVYTITYNVSDTSGNAAQEKVRTVYVLDRVAPVIRLIGKDTLDMDVGDEYSEPGATVSDNYDDSTTLTVDIIGEIDPHHPGEYTLHYHARDSSGNEAEKKKRIILVIDREAPRISLIGADTIYHEQGTPYVDSGAVATDNYDENINENVLETDSVDVDVPGVYRYYYWVTDSSGNRSPDTWRIVVVVDSEKPTISLVGADTLTYEVFSSVTDTGAQASDSHDGDLTASIRVSGTIDTATVGNYTLTYSVEDNTGNRDSVKQVIRIVDTTPPVITFADEDTIEIEVFSSYSIEVSASDGYDDDLSASIVDSGTVDTARVGEYKRYFNVVDGSGNAAEQKVCVVRVVDTQAPTITFLDDTLVMDVFTSFVDTGATARDNYDGDLTSSLQVTGTVDTALLGTYTREYRVSDGSGNTAEKTRFVRVVDRVAPNLMLVGADTVYLAVGDEYSDSGATAIDNYDDDISDSIEIVHDINSAVVGQYSVTYNVHDGSGNHADELVRTVYVEAGPPVERYGWLQVEGNKIVSKRTNQPVQLVGMSFFWSTMSWPGYSWYTPETVAELVDTWNCTVLRVAYDPNDLGSWPAVEVVINEGITRGIYVIIDWHCSQANEDVNAAVTFFTEQAQKYKDVPNVIFEIWSQPAIASWDTISQYAQEVTAAIRAQGADNLIIVGTPNRCQQPDEASMAPVADPNTAYALHFWAGSHGMEIRNRAETAMANGVALFISEFGLTDADEGYTNPAIFPEQTEEWLDWADQNKISWVNWSVSNFQASSAFSGGTYSRSESGEWVYRRIQSR